MLGVLHLIYAVLFSHFYLRRHMKDPSRTVVLG